MELVVDLVLLLIQSVLLRRIFVCGLAAWAIWWALGQAFDFGSGWVNWVPNVMGILGGAYWYWRALPPRETSGSSAHLTPLSAFLGALLCLAISFALVYAIIQGEGNPFVLPGAIFFGAFGALCVWRGAQEVRAARGAAGGENAL